MHGSPCAGRDSLSPQPVEDTGRDRDPDQNHHPNAPGEDVIVVRQSAPRVTRDVIREQEFECERQCGAEQADGEGLAG